MPDDGWMTRTLRYGSVCDGMGAAHVASRGLNWRCVWLAEIDEAASATTAHHYPDVPNLGDITAEDFIKRAREMGGLDLLVGGTPCQSFSIAGLRKGLEDSRGNLTLRFVEIADATGPDGTPVDAVLYENVPGVLSDKTNGFGSLLAGLVGEDTPIPAPRGGWTNAGMVAGPTRTAAWRVLDAQGFVAQRRRRVFVVAARHGSRISPSGVLLETEADALRSLGDRAYTGPLFPQRQGLRGHSAAGGSAGEIVAAAAEAGSGASFVARVAPTIPARTKSGGGLGTDFDCDGGLIACTVTGDITHALNTANNGKHCSEDGTGRGVLIIGTAVSVALRGREGGGMIEMGDDVAHALRASQGGGDKPHVLAPTAYRTSPNCGAWETGDRVDALTTGTDPSSHLVTYPILEPGARTGTSTTDARAGMGIGSDGDPMYTLQAGKQHGVAVAFQERGREGGRNVDVSEELSYALTAPSGGGRRQELNIATGMAVRRLTPVECLKLQSFPPDYFDNVVYRGKPLADGSRYKMVGNSWNTETVRWIFRRIDSEWRVP